MSVAARRPARCCEDADLDGRTRRAGRADRPERRRQDHAAAGGPGLLRPSRGQRPGRRPHGRSAARADRLRAAAPRVRLGLPDLGRGRGHDRPQRPPRPVAPARGGGLAGGRRGARARPDERPALAGRSASCPAASASACWSPGRWRCGRPRCCSTSRSPASTCRPRSCSSELFLSLAREDRAVLMTTHDLAGALYGCDRLALLNRTIVAVGTPGELADDAELWMRTFGIGEHSPLLQHPEGGRLTCRPPTSSRDLTNPDLAFLLEGAADRGHVLDRLRRRRLLRRAARDGVHRRRRRPRRLPGPGGRVRASAAT